MNVTSIEAELIAIYIGLISVIKRKDTYNIIMTWPNG